MKDAFDDLERDLRAAVRARRRPRLVRMPVLALAAALVLGGGGAVAATRIATSPSAEREGIALAHRAVGDTIAAPACGRPAKTGRTTVGDGPVLPEIARLLPGLTRPAREVLRHPHYSAGTLLRSTARVIELSGDLRLSVFVIEGPDLTARADPAGCAAARRARAIELAAGHSAAVRLAAEREIAGMRDTAPGLQTLWVQLSLGKGKGGFGTGMRLRPSDRIGPGIVASGSNGRFADGARRYVGIADPRTARVLVDPAHGRSKAARVQEGFYKFALPPGSGHADLRELDAAGATVRTFPLRG